MGYNMIRLIKENEIDLLDDIYLKTIEHIENSDVNYSSWVRDEYPTRSIIIDAHNRGDMFVSFDEEKMSGSVILNNSFHKSYVDGKWTIEAPIDQILAVHTLVISPEFYRKSVATKLLQFAEDFAKENGYKVIRLDTSISNIPAQKLYEKFGYKRAGLIDLELNFTDNMFLCYEKEVL